MIFTKQCDYDGTELIKGMEEYRKINNFASGKGAMAINPAELDPFFTDLIKDSGLGNVITKAQVHFMEPGTDHEAGHTHEDNAGVFYLKTAPGTSKLTFPDTGEEVIPKDSLFAVVPKGVNHGMSKNESNETRITLAFWFE